MGEQVRVALELGAEEDGIVDITMLIKLLQDVELALEGLEGRFDPIRLVDEVGVIRRYDGSVCIFSKRHLIL